MKTPVFAEPGLAATLTLRIAFPPPAGEDRSADDFVRDSSNRYPPLDFARLHQRYAGADDGARKYLTRLRKY